MKYSYKRVCVQALFMRCSRSDGIEQEESCSVDESEIGKDFASIFIPCLCVSTYTCVSHYSNLVRDGHFQSRLTFARTHVVYESCLYLLRAIYT